MDILNGMYRVYCFSKRTIILNDNWILLKKLKLDLTKSLLINILLSMVHVMVFVLESAESSYITLSNGRLKWSNQRMRLTFAEHCFVWYYFKYFDQIWIPQLQMVSISNYQVKYLMKISLLGSLSWWFTYAIVIDIVY